MNVQRAYMLDEDVGTFDATFFNISPNEAESIGKISLTRIRFIKIPSRF